jgi:hypothetical protein
MMQVASGLPSAVPVGGALTAMSGRRPSAVRPRRDSSGGHAGVRGPGRTSRPRSTRVPNPPRTERDGGRPTWGPCAVAAPSGGCASWRRRSTRGSWRWGRSPHSGRRGDVRRARLRCRRRSATSRLPTRVCRRSSRTLRRRASRAPMQRAGPPGGPGHSCISLHGAARRCAVLHRGRLRGCRLSQPRWGSCPPELPAAWRARSAARVQSHGRGFAQVGATHSPELPERHQAQGTAMFAVPYALTGRVGQGRLPVPRALVTGPPFRKHVSPALRIAIRHLTDPDGSRRAIPAQPGACRGHLGPLRSRAAPPPAGGGLPHGAVPVGSPSSRGVSGGAQRVRALGALQVPATRRPTASGPPHCRSCEPPRLWPAGIRPVVRLGT